jgi:hypothetical protein
VRSVIVASPNRRLVMRLPQRRVAHVGVVRVGRAGAAGVIGAPRDQLAANEQEQHEEQAEASR